MTGGRQNGSTAVRLRFCRAPVLPFLSMQIVIITATPQSVAAGSGTFVAIRNLQAGLTTLGHDVTIVDPSWSRLPGAYALRRWLFNRRLDPQRYTGADLVVGIDLDGYAVAPRLEPPFIAYVLGQLADEAWFERGVTRWSMQLQARWERRAVERAALVITASAYSKARVAALYRIAESKIAVVPPGIDAEGWAARVDAARGKPHRVPTVLAVAHLYPRKNLGALIDAAAVLKRRGTPARVRIVGDGPERRRLRRRVRQRNVRDVVELVGFVPDDRLPGEFAQADVFCLPSLQEGFGIVFIQAMAAGLPVVALRASSTPEVIQEGVTGVLTEPGDASALTDALAGLLANPSLRMALGAAGRARARAFGMRAAATRFLEASLGGGM
jgi:glycosyltransferase involved in cell wall biosynthesis